jgi:hypothetical protein
MVDKSQSEEPQVQGPNEKANLTPVFVVGTLIWTALFALFLASKFADWGVGWQIFMLTVTVAGPPFFYNYFMWLGENTSEESFKARLAASAAKGAEIWGPFWVAVGAICLAIYAGGCF